MMAEMLKLTDDFVPQRGGARGSVIITGGAGFVGSHLAERLLSDEQFKDITKIYLIDNLVRTNSTRNIDHLLKDSRVQFIHGDISTFEYEDYFKSFKNIEIINSPLYNVYQVCHGIADVSIISIDCSFFLQSLNLICTEAKTILQTFSNDKKAIIANLKIEMPKEDKE